MSRSGVPAPESHSVLAITAGRISGLDGLRVLAVALIILAHQGIGFTGWAGVQLFFVLSGYLITRLLWDAREQPLGAYLSGFYARRALRIFPLYYAVLICFSAATLVGSHESGLRASLPYLATYTFNLWQSTAQSADSAYVGHFWSLSVEEQFYLLWPLFIYLCRRANLKAILLGIVLTGPLIRLAEVFVLRAWPGAGPHIDFDVYVLTPTYIDGFALGACVALFPIGGSPRAFFTCLALLMTSFYVAMSGGGLRDSGGMGPGYILIWGYSLSHLTWALGIDCVVHGKLARGFLDARPMRYLGRISYGLYVFHLPVQTALGHIAPGAGIVVRLTVEVAATIALAAASFQFLEKPFLARKERWLPTRSTMQNADSSREAPPATVEAQ